MTDLWEPAAPETAAADIETDHVASGETAHAFLRRVTRPLHDGVEAAFERLDLRTLDGLAAFLLGQAHALLPLERALEDAGVEALLPDWPARRRAPLLAADLARLGVPLPPATHEAPRPHGPVQSLGMLYVLEGSKLGGRVLHRRVLSSMDSRVRYTDAFLGHHHPRGWASFLAILNAVVSEPGTWDALRCGAETAFASFGRASENLVPRHGVSLASRPLSSGASVRHGTQSESSSGLEPSGATFACHR